MFYVGLEDNKCIDQEFQGAIEIPEMPKTVSDQCGFCLSNEEIGNCDMMRELKLSIGKISAEQKRQNEVLETKDEEIAKLKGENAKLKAKLGFAKDSNNKKAIKIATLETQLNLFSDFKIAINSVTMLSQYNKVLADKTKDLEKTVNEKQNKNDKLLNENRKIKEKLKKKTIRKSRKNYKINAKSDNQGQATEKRNVSNLG